MFCRDDSPTHRFGEVTEGRVNGTELRHREGKNPIHALTHCDSRTSGETSGAHRHVYYCHHLPEANCPCRKPKTAMLERAAQDLELPLRGFMVGDKTSDLLAGRAAGLAAVLVRTGYGEKTVAEEKNLDADFIAADLAEAVEWILSHQSDTEGLPLHKNKK
jgi:hypothetical protein